MFLKGTDNLEQHPLKTCNRQEKSPVDSNPEEFN